jgi:hypothetical protein
LTHCVSPSSEPPGEMEPQVVQVRNRLECPSRNRKRPRTLSGDSLHEYRQGEADRTNQIGKASARGISAKRDGGGREDEQDPKLVPLVSSSSVRITSDPVQEVVQEEATPDACLPPGWTRIKLESDW